MWQVGVCFNVSHPVRLSSAEGLVTWWVLVWWHAEAEDLFIAVSSAGKGFLKQVVTPLEQPEAGPLSCWNLFLVTLSMASGFDFPICEREGVICPLYLLSVVQHMATLSQFFSFQRGKLDKKRYFAFKMRVDCEKEEGPQTSCTQWLYGGACFLYLSYEPRVLKMCTLISWKLWLDVLASFFFSPGFLGVLPMLPSVNL